MFSLISALLTVCVQRDGQEEIIIATHVDACRYFCVKEELTTIVMRDFRAETEIKTSPDLDKCYIRVTFSYNLFSRFI